MLENLREGNAFMEELFEEFVKHHEKPLNACYLESQIVDFRYIINSHIPKDVKENWTYCDMEIFTDKFHYRKYFNEIENDKATEYFLELILETLGVATNDGNETNFSLRLYDFNDYDILACDMESTSIAHVSYLARVPFIIIRTISDVVYQNPGGFVGTNSNLFHSGNATTKEKELAKRVLKGEYYHPATNALWFYAPGDNKNCMTTWWDQRLSGKYKNHCFYKPKAGVCRELH